MIKPLTVSELADMAFNGKAVPIDRALATFADPSNWVQIYDSKPRICKWAWIGPGLPPFEMAGAALYFRHPGHT